MKEMSIKRLTDEILDACVKEKTFSKIGKYFFDQIKLRIL